MIRIASSPPPLPPGTMYTTQEAQIKPLRGFDRLAAAGFSEDDILNFRRQFHSRSAADYLSTAEFPTDEECACLSHSLIHPPLTLIIHSRDARRGTRARTRGAVDRRPRQRGRFRYRIGRERLARTRGAQRHHHRLLLPPPPVLFPPSAQAGCILGQRTCPRDVREYRLFVRVFFLLLPCCFEIEG